MNGSTPLSWLADDVTRFCERIWAERAAAQGVHKIQVDGVNIIDSGDGIYITGANGERLIDGPAGMWCVNLGHRRAELAAWCKRLGWSFTVNHTDRLASDALVKIHMAMTADGGYASGARSSGVGA